MCTEARTRYDTALASGDPTAIATTAHAYAATDQGDAYFSYESADAYDIGDDTEWVRLGAIRDQGRAIRHHSTAITLPLTLGATRAEPPAQPVYARPTKVRKHHFGGLRAPHYG